MQRIGEYSHIRRGEMVRTGYLGWTTMFCRRFFVRGDSPRVEIPGDSAGISSFTPSRCYMLFSGRSELTPLRQRQGRG
jgi:hypothetical protein